MGQPKKRADPDALLADEMGELALYPDEFVLIAFDWGSGQLENHEGPDQWQRDYLEDLGRQIRERNFNGHDPVEPVQEAVASGHGIGKSALVAWLILFFMSTRPMCKGTVTATTNDQLRTKTWGELAKWKKLCITEHWFEVGSAAGHLNIHRKGFKEQWRIDGQSCKEENSEAFAGQHAADSSSIYIFDEASGVPDKIWEVAEGGLTDGEPFRLVFGNPTKNSGAFRNCFGSQKHRWNTRQIDSRNVKRTNKKQIQKWIDDYGEDSDFVRVRVRGLFPNASSMQFFPTEDVTAAMSREVEVDPTDPVVLSVDVARFGSDKTVIRGRRGFDCRSIPKRTLDGADTMVVTAAVAEMARTYRPDIIFVDVGGVGGGVYDRLRQLNWPVHPVDFGSKGVMVDGQKPKNKKAEIYLRGRAALRFVALDEDPAFNDEMSAIEYGYAADQTSIQIESKEDLRRRIGYSPDDTDAYCMLWAEPVASRNLDALDVDGYDDVPDDVDSVTGW
ncbi:MAG: terminase [Pseudomonadota bacterium]